MLNRCIDDDGCTHLVHPRVYALADMLGVESLKLIALKKLRKQFEREQVEVEAYPTIIREVYSTTGTRDKQIRETVVVPTGQHVEALVKERISRRCFLSTRSLRLIW